MLDCHQCTTKNTTHYYFHSPDRLNFVHFVLENEVIKFGVHIIQQVHNLQGAHLPRHFRKPNNVREENCCWMGSYKRAGIKMVWSAVVSR